MSMVKTLLKSVRQYKKPSIITPFFMAVEAFCECLLPYFMARMITAIDIKDITSQAALQEILKYGAILVALAILSMTSGALAGKFAATASCGFASNLRHDLFYRRQRANRRRLL